MPAEGIWSAQDTTPAAIEAALRELLKEQRQRGLCPARVLNMVAVVDREWRGEIYNRLDGVGRYHARTILCAVEQGRQTIDAWVTMSAEQDPRPGQIALTHERVVLDVGPEHLKALDTVVDPLVISDLATVCWSPHGHPRPWTRSCTCRRSCCSTRFRSPTGWGRPPGVVSPRRRTWSTSPGCAPPRGVNGSARASTHCSGARSSAGWLRDRPAQARLGVAGLLFFGWLCSRLGWQPGTMMQRNGELFGRASARRGDVELVLQPDLGRTRPASRGSPSRRPPACRSRSTAAPAACRRAAARAMWTESA